MYRLFIKRMIDVAFAVSGLMILSPIFLVLGIAVALDDPGPVFFAQKRIGKNRHGRKHYFTIYKFRTMKTNAPRDVATHLMTRPEAYMTRVGRLLRRSSLDELPQLWNILMGDMSIIGPRPALWNQDDLYALREAYGANDVTPGLSGWAQVNGRDELENAVKAKYDGDYAKQMSFKMDVICFFMTIVCVISGKGILKDRANGL